MGIRKAAQPYSRKAKRLVSAEADWWRRGELNPGPMTEPTVFYVRSLLAKLAIFLPHRCRRQLMASISAVKVPMQP